MFAIKENLADGHETQHFLWGQRKYQTLYLERLDLLPLFSSLGSR